MPHSLDRHLEPLRDVFLGRRVILASSVIGPALVWARHLRNLGAARPLVLSPANHADGDGGAAQLADVVSLRGAGSTLDDHLGAPSPELRRAVDDYDPNGDAVFISVDPSGLGSFLGRARLGAPVPEWAAHEDKTTVDALWDRAGVRRARSEVVEVGTALWDVARRLDAGLGTVWSGSGPRGGGSLVRRVRTLDEAREALARLGRGGARIRIAPFLEGLPCSIHGMVFPAGVLALRPVEQLTLWGPDPSVVRFHGVSALWDPPAAARSQMRDAVGRVGATIAAESGYRGAFTIDGLWTSTGFVPTELNARPGQGLVVLSEAAPRVPLLLIDAVLRAGHGAGFDVAGLETDLLDAIEDVRPCRGQAHVPLAVDRDSEVSLSWTSRRFERCEARDRSLAVWLHPAGETVFVRFVPEPDAFPRGPSFAPVLCAAMAWTDAELGTAFGAVRPSA